MTKRSTAPTTKIEIDGASFHRINEPDRTYAVIEWRVSERDASGSFAETARHTATIAGPDVRAWLKTIDGAGLYALMKRTLYAVLVARGDAPAGQPALTDAEQEAIDSLAGRLLAQAQP